MRLLGSVFFCFISALFVPVAYSMGLEKQQPPSEDSSSNELLKKCLAMKIPLAKVTVTKENLQALIDNYYNLAEELSPVDLSKALEAAHNFELTKENLKTKKEKISIMAFGDTSAGKSSFLNLLLGEDLLYTSDAASTSCICCLIYGEQKGITVFYDLGEVESFTYDQATTPQEIACKIQPYIAKDRSDKSKLIERVDIMWPNNILKSGIILVDSPGLTEDGYSSWAENFLQQATCVICVINCMEQLRKETIQMLRQATKYKMPVLVILTKLDLVRNPESIVISIEEKLRTIITKYQICPINIPVARAYQRRNRTTKELDLALKAIANHITIAFDLASHELNDPPVVTEPVRRPQEVIMRCIYSAIDKFISSGPLFDLCCYLLVGTLIGYH